VESEAAAPSCDLTIREIELMEALRDALSMLTPRQAFGAADLYDTLYRRTIPLDLPHVQAHKAALIAAASSPSCPA
jgi:hypothetical protein